MNKPGKRPAVFLDRDGTINIEKEYLYKVEDFEFIPGAPEAICVLKEAGFLVVVVTNQSGVARGYYTLQDVHRLHEHMQEQLAIVGTEVDAFYICPHHPEKGNGEYLLDCDCRKGRPGMLLQAAEDFGIDLKRSFMVGDKIADIQAAEGAGCKPILVLTGYGQATRDENQLNDVMVCTNLSAAADLILKEKARSGS